MRILLISNLYPPFVEGGAEILAERVAAGLEGCGHEIIVLTSKVVAPVFPPHLPEGDRKGTPLLYTKALGQEAYHQRFPEKKADIQHISPRNDILCSTVPGRLRMSISRAMAHTPYPRATIKAHPSSTRPPSPLRESRFRFKWPGQHWRLTALPSSIWVRRPGQRKRPLRSTSIPLSLHEGNDHTLRILDYTPPVYFDRKGSLWGQMIKPFRFYRRYHNAGNARRLREVIEAASPDIVYVWEITGIGVNSVLNVLRELHIPIVFHMGNYWLLYARDPETEQSRLHMRWFKRLLIGPIPELRWTSMIAVSESVKGEYIRAGFDAERIEVIHNSIDPRFLTLPRAACNEDKVCHLLYVGRIRAEKGIMVILKALNLLVNHLSGPATVKGLHESDSGRESHDFEMLRGTQHDNLTPVRLHIVGGGDQTCMRELKDYLKEQGLEELVVFHGKVPQDELVRHYDCSQMLLVPSLWKEPFGMVVIEGMARGLPVIASNVGGLREVIADGQNGLLVDAGDERALAQAIRELMQDTERRQRLGEAGRVMVEEGFVAGVTVSKVERHLLRVWGR